MCHSIVAGTIYLQKLQAETVRKMQTYESVPSPFSGAPTGLASAVEARVEAPARNCTCAIDPITCELIVPPGATNAPVAGQQLFSLLKDCKHSIIEKYLKSARRFGSEVCGIEFIEAADGRVLTYDVNTKCELQRGRCNVGIKIPESSASQARGIYWREISSREKYAELSGSVGKYWLPSTEMVSSDSASTTSFQTA
ncbi:hypothetical protein E3T50_10235 [Cryobacterium gelidum]|uniref:Uncharacterized protein n=1 Tax=Cryobacterium gelidum TaxID=1259164 RepID=A0A4R9AVM5_9MICO|nr:hypothetical protein E3T50_10235 [Cryobacterium gelidum]